MKRAYCLHAKAAELMLDKELAKYCVDKGGEDREEVMNQDQTSDEEYLDVVDILSMNPFAAAVGCRSHGYSVITA